MALNEASKRQIRGEKHKEQRTETTSSQVFIRNVCKFWFPVKLWIVLSHLAAGKTRNLLGGSNKQPWLKIKSENWRQLRKFSGKSSCCQSSVQPPDSHSFKGWKVFCPSATFDRLQSPVVTSWFKGENTNRSVSPQSLCLWQEVSEWKWGCWSNPALQVLGVSLLCFTWTRSLSDSRWRADYQNQACWSRETENIHGRRRYISVSCLQTCCRDEDPF